MLLTALLGALCLAQAATSQNGGICFGPEAYRQIDGGDYRGFVNTTVSGISCQAWDAQWPHVHSTQVPDITRGIGAHNYCRTPLGGEFAGCYTTDPEIRFERCDIGLPCSAPITQAQKTVYFDPAPGSDISTDSFVSITCAPKPCEIYYTLNGEEPTVSSTLYNRPVAAPPNPGPFSIKTITVFNDGAQASHTASYLEIAKVPHTSASLYPSPQVAYSSPVLVSVLTAENVINIYFQNDTTPRTYTGPFWIYATTSLVVVVGDNVLRATYQVATSPRLPSYWPPGGTYFGSVTIVFIPTVTREQFYVRVNGGSWTVMRELTIATPGSTTIDIQSVSVDKPSSTVVSATYIIAPKAQPQCSPPSGTYNQSINLTCTIGNSSVPVTKICNGTADSTRMTCSNTPSLVLGTPGTFLVAATYYDTNFNAITEMFTYTLVPVEMNQPTVEPCDGFYVDGLVASASSDEVATITFAPSDMTTNVQQTNANSAVIRVTSNAPSNASFAVRVASANPMKASPSVPKRCTLQLYPSTSISLTTSWYLLPFGWSNNGTLKNSIAAVLRAESINFIETTILYDRFFMVRLKTHPSIVRAYTRRLYDALNSIVGPANVKSSDGVLPVDEIRSAVLSAQNITEEERICATTRCQGQNFVLPCNCTTNPNNTQATSIFGVVSAFTPETSVPLVAKPVTVRFEWIGFQSFYVAKAVQAAFGCGDMGTPLQAIDNARKGMFTPRYAGRYTICVDEGKGFHSVPSTLNTDLLVMEGGVSATPTLSPCGGTFKTAIAINVSGSIDSSFYSVNMGTWQPLPRLIKIPMQSYGTVYTVAVAAQYVDQLTGVTSTTDTFACVYQFGESPARLGGLTYNFERTTAIKNTINSTNQVRINIGIEGSKAGDFAVFVSENATCSGLHSYVAKRPDDSIVTDRNYLFDASINKTAPYTICASPNADPTQTVVVTPARIALSPLSMLINTSCNARCGNGRVCIGADLCGCVGENGTVYLCGPQAPAEEPPASVGRVILALLALITPIVLGIALFYGVKWYNAKKLEEKH